MAGILDPFNPGVDATPMAGVDPGTFDKVRAEWDSFLGNPQGRAALLSAGLALMQPPSFGDTGASQIGRAIGAGGQSATANQVMDMKEREQDSKVADRESRASLRESQGMLAEARAATAGARSETGIARLEIAQRALDLKAEQLKNQSLSAEQRLEIQRQKLELERQIAEIRKSEGAARSELGASRLEGAQERNRLSNQVRLSQMYQTYVKDVAKRNDPITLSMRPGATPEPVLPMGDWIKANPLLRNMGLTEAEGTPEDDVLIPPGAGTVARPVSPRASAVGERKQFRDPKTGNPVWGTWDGSKWVPE